MSRSSPDIGRALALLREGLAPFVERELTRLAKSDRFADFLRSNPQLRQKRIRDWEVYALLKAMEQLWGEVFRQTLRPMERGFVYELSGWRNNWAHQEPLPSADEDRALDTTVRLLRAVKAETQAGQVALLRESRQAGRKHPPNLRAEPSPHRRPPPGSTSMSQADEIRLHAMENHVVPWRESGKETLAIRAGDIVREMALSQATPNVCSALEGGKFQAQADLVLVGREGPHRSTTTTYYYRQG